MGEYWDKVAGTSKYLYLFDTGGTKTLLYVMIIFTDPYFLCQKKNKWPSFIIPSSVVSTT